MTMATGNAAKAVFEEGKAYKCGGEVFTVTARGDIAVGFENSNGNIFSARIRGTADSECACYAGMTIWAAAKVEKQGEYFIEVYDEDGDCIGQEEYPDLLEAYDAVEDVRETYEDFHYLEITDSEGVTHLELRKNGLKTFCERELISLLQDRENAEKNPLKEKIADLKAAEKIISEKYLSLCRSLYVKIDGEYQSAFGFDDYVTKYHDTFYSKEGNDYVEDTAAYRELKEIEREWNALFKELEYFENIEEKAEILKSKIAEQKSHPHKGIDWKATFDDMKISEILNLQKDLKKFLKLGQIDLAENIFSMLKTLCRNYREQVAA